MVPGFCVSTDAVEAALHALMNTTDTDARRAADAGLRQFQATAQAWNTAVALIANAASPQAKLFGATILCNKLRGGRGGGLAPADVNALRGRCLQLLRGIESGQLLSQLCRAVCLLLVDVADGPGSLLLREAASANLPIDTTLELLTLVPDGGAWLQEAAQNGVLSIPVRTRDSVTEELGMGDNVERAFALFRAVEAAMVDVLSTASDEATEEQRTTVAGDDWSESAHKLDALTIVHVLLRCQAEFSRGGDHSKWRLRLLRIPKVGIIVPPPESPIGARPVAGCCSAPRRLIRVRRAAVDVSDANVDRAASLDPPNAHEVSRRGEAVALASVKQQRVEARPIKRRAAGQSNVANSSRARATLTYERVRHTHQRVRVRQPSSASVSTQAGSHPQAPAPLERARARERRKWRAGVCAQRRRRALPL